MGVCCVGLIAVITLSCCCISITVCKDDCKNKLKARKLKGNPPPKRQKM